MRKLYIDLETTPVLGYVWRAYEDSLLNIKEDFKLLCFAYAWDDDKVRVVSGREYTENNMVRQLWELFNGADVIIAQNGDKFDIKVSNALFIRYKLDPPAPYKTVDTLKLAKKYFRFTKNNLDWLAFSLVGEKKHETFKDLWFKCMDGDIKSFKIMEGYCAQDVSLLRKVYHKLKSWHTGHPNYNVYNESTHKCPVCGGETQKRGFLFTRVGRYQRHQCKSCAAWSKGLKINSDKVIS